MDLNKVTLIGNMVRDPESRTMPSGQTVVRFTLATNYAWQDARTKAKKEAVDFHDVLAWGKLGDIIAQYVKKGSKVYIEGRLRKRRAVRKDGTRQTTTEIVADNMIMLGHRTRNRPTTEASVSSRLVREDVDVEEEADV
jgi:single-strand DNA-binding protein